LHGGNLATHYTIAPSNHALKLLLNVYYLQTIKLNLQSMLL